MPILTVSPSHGRSGPYMDSVMSQNSSWPRSCLITQCEIDSTTLHVILNKVPSDWGDPIEILDVENSEISGLCEGLLADG